MNNDDLQEHAMSLIKMAQLIGPEGEGLDVSDREYELQDFVDLKRTLSTMRTAIDETNRSLAAAWIDQYGEHASVLLDGEYNYLGASKKLKYQPNMEEVFAEWLIQQDAATVARMIPAYGLRKGQVDQAARDTFFTEEVTNKDLRIQSKPQK
jgi:hypothetical protein